MLVDELQAVVMNLDEHELLMVYHFGVNDEVRQQSAAVGDWLRRIALAEKERRESGSAMFPDIDDGGWTDAAAGGALAVTTGLVNLAIGREKLRDFADTLQKFFCGVAINRLRARTIAAHN